jgi:DNA-binding HxlR family transcriptional regulator
LADRLKKLIAAGILSREDAARGARARYSLTEAGIQTVPIIFALGNWGLDWRDGTPDPSSAFAKNSCATKNLREQQSTTSC